MRRGTLAAAALGAFLAACEGRELSVFDVPAMLAGSSSQAGAAGAGEPSGGAGGSGSRPAGDSLAGSATAGSVAVAGGSGGNGGAPPQAGGGGMPPGMTMPQPCESDDDCQGWICDKPGCDAVSGFCKPWPLFCDAMPRPVCGCDGVTYWNDCIRVQSHARLAAPDQCFDTACTCEVGSDCKVPGASCGHLLPPNAMCGHAMGSCWMLPAECDAAADPKRWHECKPPDGAEPQCVDTCTAISQEHSYAELHRGDPCP
jgi:hypothetical protein